VKKREEFERKISIFFVFRLTQFSMIKEEMKAIKILLVVSLFEKFPPKLCDNLSETDFLNAILYLK